MDPQSRPPPYSGRRARPRRQHELIDEDGAPTGLDPILGAVVTLLLWTIAVRHSGSQEKLPSLDGKAPKTAQITTGAWRSLLKVVPRLVGQFGCNAFW
jgi:hypothetical protein